jgi:selenocysteine lyase/cysteine desulfurase
MKYNFDDIALGYEGIVPSNPADIVECIRNDIVGSFSPFDGPFGPKPIIYTDWTTTSRALNTIETYVLNEILQFYGNIHSPSSRTGHQSSCFRHESRKIISDSINAKVFNI